MFSTLVAAQESLSPSTMTAEEMEAQIAEVEAIIEESEADLRLDEDYARLSALKTLLSTSTDPMTLIHLADSDGSLTSLLGTDATAVDTQELVVALESLEEDEEAAAARKEKRKSRLKKGLKIAAGLAAGAAAAYGAKKLYDHKTGPDHQMHKTKQTANEVAHHAEELSVMEGALRAKDMKTALRKNYGKPSPNLDPEKDIDTALTRSRGTANLSLDSGTSAVEKIEDHIDKLRESGADKQTIRALEDRLRALHLKLHSSAAKSMIGRGKVMKAWNARAGKEYAKEIRAIRKEEDAKG